MATEKVYILSRGDYSDYTIIGVETDKARAKRIQKLMTGDGYGSHVDIEEWDVGDFGEGITDLPADRFHFNVFLGAENRSWFRGRRIDGLVVEKTDSTNVKADSINKVKCWDYNNYCSVTVEARDHEHAAKTGGDLFAAFRAKEYGIEG